MSMRRRLSSETLAEVREGVTTPEYRGRDPRVGIIHIGVGNFHRSHQAAYIDRLLHQDPRAPWSIRGIGARPEDDELAGELAAQDGLYSLTLLGSDRGAETRVIGSLVDMLLLRRDPAATVAALADPGVRIVTLTITESGYVEDPSAGRAAMDDPDVRADVATGFAAPRSSFGLLIAGLLARREAGTPAFTVLSCDNIPQNGLVARASTVAVAGAFSPELADWIVRNVRFPSSMVDRITPRASLAQVEMAVEMLGVDDRAVVVAEPYIQWVIEDDFPSGRPALECVGVTFTKDVGPYEEMKLRLLNGGHQVLAYIGLLRGHTLVHEAMQDDIVLMWLERYWHTVALPSLALPDGVEGEAYLGSLRERFANPAVGDTLERLAADSTSRVGKFILPALEHASLSAPAQEVAGVVFASWATVLTQTASAVILDGVDPALREGMSDRVDRARFLGLAGWGSRIAADPEVRRAVLAAREAFASDGASVALETAFQQSKK